MPELEMAAEARGDARVATTGSMSSYISFFGKLLGPPEAKYFEKSEAGTLEGNDLAHCEERYHQTKLGQVLFALALSEKLEEKGSKVKSVAFDPGWCDSRLQNNMLEEHEKSGDGSENQQVLSLCPCIALKDFFGKGGAAHSAADGSADMLTVLFMPDVASGDMYAPENPTMAQKNGQGTPVKILAAGKGLPANHPHLVGLVENSENKDLIWTKTCEMLGANGCNAEFFDLMI